MGAGRLPAFLRSGFALMLGVVWWASRRVSIGVAAMVKTARLPELSALAVRRLYAVERGGRGRLTSLD